MSRTYRLRRLPRSAYTPKRNVEARLAAARRLAEAEDERRVAHDVLGLECIADPHPDPKEYTTNGYENSYRKEWLKSCRRCLEAAGYDRWRRLDGMFTPWHLLLPETAPMGAYPGIGYLAHGFNSGTKRAYRRLVHKSARNEDRRLLRIVGGTPEFDHDETVFAWRDKLIAENLWSLY